MHLLRHRAPGVGRGMGLAAVCAALLATSAYSADDGANQPKPARHYFVKKGQGTRFDVDGRTPTEIKLTSEQTDGRFTFQDEIWKPNFTVPAHFHKEHSETFYVIEGQLEWVVNGETHVMSAGDLLYIPPDTVHAVRVLGGKDVHVLFIYEPGGYEKYILDEMSYSPQEREKPEVKQKLRERNDFNPVQEPVQKPMQR